MSFGVINSAGWGGLYDGINDKYVSIFHVLSFLIEEPVSHVKLDDQDRVLGVWFLFLNGVGVKARGKVTGYANPKGIGREMLPLTRSSATVLNRNRLIHAKRNHFPLKPACFFTICKTQEESFDEIDP
ncbi:hypothetical protein TNCV_3017471 [Trichonephila clavipes]|nr:hypothetical protein TNCV_3017471 [Trichonephila clavipes]